MHVPAGAAAAAARVAVVAQPGVVGHRRRAAAAAHARERREQPLGAVAAALRARDRVVGPPDELLEALLAGLAAVLVDRHGAQSTDACEIGRMSDYRRAP